MADDAVQWERVFKQLESIDAQLRSMRETMHENNEHYQQRITAVERDLASMKLAADKQEAFTNGEIEELARAQGVIAASVKLLEDAKTLGDGVADEKQRNVLLWRYLIGTGLAALGLWNAWLHSGGHQ